MTARPGATIHRDTRPLELEFGGVLPELEIACETHGRLSEKRDNAILLCPAFSAHSHIKSNELDPQPGWWEEMVGPGRAFDTDRYFVIGASLLGSCYGTTGPVTIDSATGRAFAERFPVVTTRDMIDVHMRLLDLLGIERLHAVAGGSLGAMQTIGIATRHPNRVKKVVTISGTDYTRPYTAAIRHIGRRAIMLDPRYRSGAYGDDPPLDGLRLARELGTLFYRAREEFNTRFERQPIAPPRRDGITFDVQSYLDYQGRKILAHFDVNAYLTLSLAMDLHDIGRTYGSLDDAYRRVTAEVMVVGVPEDRLIPEDEQRGIYDGLARAEKRVIWRELSSPIGHDAFLVEINALTPIFREFLDDPE